MHGGAEGSGAPPGNQTALKHGAYTKEALHHRAEMRALIREARKLLKELGWFLFATAVAIRPECDAAALSRGSAWGP